MSYRPSRQARRVLLETARLQGGYFTTQQAKDAGYGYAHLNYHVHQRNVCRVGRGLYRMPEIPPSPQDDLIRLSLWSRDRFGVPQAVVSGPSALAVYELSDLIPSKVHLTVPPTFRKAAPKGAVLQRARLAPQDVIEHEGYSVTSPLRTLLDVAAEGAVSTEQLVRAAADALEAGLVRRSALQDAAEREPAAARLLRLLDQR